jgi:RHS repeat-associated protein
MFWAVAVNLYLTRFRAYDPEIGRWLSRDPLRTAEVEIGANLFAYVGNNPINKTDVSGLDPFDGLKGGCKFIGELFEERVGHEFEGALPGAGGTLADCAFCFESGLEDLKDCVQCALGLTIPPPGPLTDCEYPGHDPGIHPGGMPSPCNPEPICPEPGPPEPPTCR